MKNLLTVSCILLIATLLYKNAVAQSGNSPGQTCTKYLKWYVNNRERLNKYYDKIIDGEPGGATAYQLSHEGLNDYINEISESGYVSKTYLGFYRLYFEKCGKRLEKEKQYDGPVKEMAFDVILGTMEYSEVTDNIAIMKIDDTKIEDDKAWVKATIGPHISLLYSLTKKNDGWLIDGSKLISN